MPLLGKDFKISALDNARVRLKKKKRLGTRIACRGTRLVRLTGLEPAFLAEMEPKSIVSASFTTGAYNTTIIT